MHIQINFFKARVSSVIKRIWRATKKGTCGFYKQSFQNNIIIGKGLFFNEHITNKMKTPRSREIWFLLQEGKRFLESF